MAPATSSRRWTSSPPGLMLRAYRLPKLRGNARVVGVIAPALPSDGQNVLIDARMNSASRLAVLRQGIAALRAKFEDDLVLVVAPAGFFGYEGKVPLHSEDGGRVLEARGELVKTTVGRVLFYANVVPAELPFSLVNRALGKKQLGELIDRCYRLAGAKKTVLLADALMQMGFRMSTAAGISVCIDDMRIPASSRPRSRKPPRKLVKPRTSTTMD